VSILRVYCEAVDDVDFAGEPAFVLNYPTNLVQHFAMQWLFGKLKFHRHVVDRFSSVFPAHHERAVLYDLRVQMEKVRLPIMALGRHCREFVICEISRKLLLEVPEFRESVDLTLKPMRRLIHLDTSLQLNVRFVELSQNLLRHWSRKTRMSNPITAEFQMLELSLQFLLFEKLADFDQKVRRLGFGIDTFIQLLFEFLQNVHDVQSNYSLFRTAWDQRNQDY